MISFILKWWHFSLFFDVVVGAVGRSFVTAILNADVAHVRVPTFFTPTVVGTTTSTSTFLGSCTLHYCDYKIYGREMKKILKSSGMVSSQALFASISSNSDEIQLSKGLTQISQYERDDNNSFVDQVRITNLKDQHYDYLRKNHFEAAFRCISEIVVFLQQVKQRHSQEQILSWVHSVDCMLQAFTSRAFSPPYDASNPYNRQRVYLGVDAIHFQLSSSTARNGNVTNFPSPYNTIEKGTLLLALNALTSFNGDNDRHSSKLKPERFDTATDEAFRVLQRLVSGVGVRSNVAHGGMDVNNKTSYAKTGTISIEERYFNRLLNSFSSAGRMEMAHRVLALQERLPNGPPLSRVAYSILLKGYGRKLRDIQNVESVLRHAIRNEIEPDTILLNSLMDAYINCNRIDKARQLFLYMKRQHPGEGQTTLEELDNSILLKWFQRFPCPRPNRRTYNTMLKGVANSGLLKEALLLADEMKRLRLWDTVTTNTVVHATIKVGDLQLAEDILANYTAKKWDAQHKAHHPNVEAYTELLDAYSKMKQLPKAIATLQTMRKRDVIPNEVTYTCLLGGFGRCRKTEQAKSTLQFMNSTNVRVTTKSYNALISGLVQWNTFSDYSNEQLVSSDYNDQELDERVDEALKLLRHMIHRGVHPNDITVSVLVDALGRCVPPRLNEASVLVKNLEDQNFISRGSTKIATALVQSYGKAGDIVGAIAAFRKIQQPDRIAVNSFLDAFARCGRIEMMTHTFRKYYQNPKTKRLEPDVISYSILIGALLKTGSTSYVKQAFQMYEDMKKRNINFDKALIDLILKAMVRFGNPLSPFDKPSALLVTSVLRDAENLTWDDGQLERRKRAVRDRLRDVLKNDISIEISSPPATSPNDDLFERKGWNTVDSGFLLWGRGRRESEKRRSTTNQKAACKFLESHGWNDVNSGFRLF